jgi:hypothetical protein
MLMNKRDKISQKFKVSIKETSQCLYEPTFKYEYKTIRCDEWSTKLPHKLRQGSFIYEYD